VKSLEKKLAVVKEDLVEASSEVPGADGAPTPEITSQPFTLEPQRRK